MGMHDARHDGEAEDVAVALNEQYQPRFAGDDLPSNPVACALAIADKMDTLAGIFGIGQHPKGDKDPFALRRAALGVLRIIVEKNLNLDLGTRPEEAVRLYGDKLMNANVVDDVIDFMLGRFRAWYQDEGYTVDTIQAGTGASSDSSGRFRCPYESSIALPYPGCSCSTGGGEQACI